MYRFVTLNCCALYYTERHPRKTAEVQGCIRGEMIMRRRIVLAALMLVLIFNFVPLEAEAATYLPKLSDKTMYYTPDYRSGECIVSSCKSMFRRAAVKRGSYLWDTITNADLRGTATTSGGAFRHSFYYINDGISYHVTHKEISGNAEKKTKTINELLAKHPEGIIVWGKNAASSGPHAVLIVSYSNDTFYAVDSTHNNFGSNAGIEKWSATTMKSIDKCTDIWYTDSISGKAGTTAAPSGPSTLAASDASRHRYMRAKLSVSEGSSLQITSSPRSMFPYAMNPGRPS